MSFMADAFGMTAQVNIKPCSFDFQLLKQLGSILNNPGEVIIISYALPHNPEYLNDIFDIRSKGVTIICNSKYVADAKVLKEKYPDLRIFTDPCVHAKMILANRSRVWISSTNLGITRSAEGTVGIESRAVYGFYEDEIMRRGLMNKEKEVIL